MCIGPVVLKGLVSMVFFIPSGSCNLSTEFPEAERYGIYGDILLTKCSKVSHSLYIVQM